MKILQINSSDTGIGGASRIALSLHNQYKQNGVHVALLTGTSTRSEEDIYHVPSQKWRKVLARLLANDLEYFNSNFIFEEDFYQEADIVHFHNIHGWYFNLKTFERICREKKVVWTLHDMWALTPHCAHTTIETIVDGLYPCASIQSYPSLLWDNAKHLTEVKRDVYTKSSFAIVTPSMWLKDKLQKSILKSKPIHVIPNGIDVSVFKPIEREYARKVLELPDDQTILLFIAANGLENEFKGGQYIRELIEATANTNNTFVIVGKSDPTLESQYRHVRTFGAVTDPSRLALFYNAADALLFPSLHENFPLTLLESLACGTPVIASQAGGISEIITHQSDGFIMQEISTKNLRLGMQWVQSGILNDRDEIHEKIRKNYSLAHMSNEYLHMYETLTTKHDHS